MLGGSALQRPIRLTVFRHEPLNVGMMSDSVEVSGAPRANKKLATPSKTQFSICSDLGGSRFFSRACIYLAGLSLRCFLPYNHLRRPLKLRRRRRWAGDGHRVMACCFEGPPSRSLCFPAARNLLESLSWAFLLQGLWRKTVKVQGSIPCPLAPAGARRPTSPAAQTTGHLSCRPYIDD